MMQGRALVGVCGEEFLVFAVQIRDQRIYQDELALQDFDFLLD
jgi:hypothetical protein